MSQLPDISHAGFAGYMRVSKGTPSPVRFLGGPEHLAELTGTLILQDVNGIGMVESILKPINQTIIHGWGGAAYLF